MSVTLIQRLSNFAEQVHQLDYYDEGAHDAPHFETCTATICKSLHAIMILPAPNTPSMPTEPDAPTLTPYARRMVAAVEAKKRDEREGRK